MYNSIFVGLLMKFTRSIQKMYKNSFTCHIFSIIKRYLGIVYSNSFLSKFNETSEFIFKESFIYRGVGFLFKLTDNILDKLQEFKSKLVYGSSVSEGLTFYSRNIESGLRLFYVTFILTGIVIIVGNLSAPMYLGIVLINIGVFGLLLNGLELLLLRESKIVNFFWDIFKEDEDGENWW